VTTTQDAETMALLSSLQAQRRHVLGILDGLDDEALRRPMLPSRWTCAGLVRHLAMDVERFWFRAVTEGNPAIMDEPEGTGDPADEGDNNWLVGPQVPAGAVLDLYRREAQLADAVIVRTALDSPPAWWPDFFGQWRLDDLREIILHVITETACHAGHLDAARELIDGRQWVVLTE
jgi:hypothetical protein